MTPGFTFSLQRVLDVQEKREEMAEQQWAACLSQERQVRRQLYEAQAECDRAIREWPSAAAGDVKAALCISHRLYIAHRQRLVADLREAFARAREESAAAFERLLAARRDRQALEALRDRAEAEYRRTLARREMRLLDEMASVRYWRRHSRSSPAQIADVRPPVAAGERHAEERGRTCC